jgi:hypothetical protein
MDVEFLTKFVSHFHVSEQVFKDNKGFNRQDSNSADTAIMSLFHVDLRK